MNSLYNLARVTTTTVGTGTVTLGAAVSGFLTFAQAGVPDGATLTVAFSDSNGGVEIGSGVYAAAGPTVTRPGVAYRSSGASNTARISLSGSADVFITPAAEDFTGYTAGSVFFAGTNGGLQQDNANLFWGSGGLKIGTATITTPLTALAVVGDIAIAAGSFVGNYDTGGNTQVNKLAFYDLATGDMIFSNWYGSAPYGGYVFNNNRGSSETTRVKIAGDGKVGIGIATPDASLHLVLGSNFRLSNTRTDASNGDWFEQRFASNIAIIGTDKNGSGAARDVSLVRGGVEQINFGSGGVYVPVNLGVGVGAVSSIEAIFRGADATSSNYAFYADNSAAAPILYARNDGFVYAKQLKTDIAGPILGSFTTITGGGTANAPTMTTGPVTGNPTKWLPYDDNGTTRYIPSW